MTNNKENNLLNILSSPLVDAMSEYKKSPMTGFHIPGHNRGQGIYPKFKTLTEKKMF